MRRLTLLALAGVLGLSACSDQNTESPTEPSVGPPSESFGSTCDHGRYPLASVAAQANDASLWKNKPARVEALLRLGTIALLWDTCHDQLARKAALDMILWIDKNTARNVDQTKVAALKAAILAGFGGASTSDADFVSEVYIPGTTKVITTPSAKATIKLTPGAFDEPTLITVRRLPNDFQLTDVTEGYDQEPPYWDYDATNSSTDNTLETHKVGLVDGVPAATIAFCFREDGDGEQTYPEPGASIGHNPVGGGFEIVDEVEDVPDDLEAALDCFRDPVVGSADGLRGFSRYLASMAINALLPEPLHAAAVGTRGPIAGTPISLSPFGIVRPTTPVSIPFAPNNLLGAGGAFTCAVKIDGTVTCWGANEQGQTIVPAELTGVTSIDANPGAVHTCARKGDGTVSCWGRSSEGQTTIPAGLSGVAAVTVGGVHSCALKSDGTVTCWGAEDFFAPGTNPGMTVVPVGLTGVVAVSAGGAVTCALKSNGAVVCWGSQQFGQIPVPAGLGPVKAIDVGDAHTCALKIGGTVSCWGNNNSGETIVPAGLTDVISVRAGEEHTCALKSDGTITCWGSNTLGQTNVPVGLTDVAALSAGNAHSCAMKNDGTVTCWGVSVNGELDVPEGLDLNGPPVIN